MPDTSQAQSKTHPTTDRLGTARNREPSTQQPVPDQLKTGPSSDASEGTTAHPTETPLSEIEARTLLAALFREAGYRILHDVVVASEGGSLTLDGFDSIRRVGFEYIDRNEQSIRRNPAVDTVLVVGPGQSDVVSEKARVFLEKHPVLPATK